MAPTPALGRPPPKRRLCRGCRRSATAPATTCLGGSLCRGLGWGEGGFLPPIVWTAGNFSGPCEEVRTNTKKEPTFGQSLDTLTCEPRMLSGAIPCCIMHLQHWKIEQKTWGEHLLNSERLLFGPQFLLLGVCGGRAGAISSTRIGEESV